MKKPNIQFYNVSERTYVIQFYSIPELDQKVPDPKGSGSHTEKMRRGLARIFQRYHTVQYGTVPYRTVLQLEDNIHRTN
jgi:hypothetical protein